MFCPQCGNQTDDNAAVCLKCGITLPPLKKREGKVGAGWWWLGFLIPIAGLFVWIFCQNEEPIKAKKAGIGALIGTILSVLLCILITLLPVILLIFLGEAYYI